MAQAKIVEDVATGAKARGLALLPSAWVPKRFTLSPELHRRWVDDPHDLREQLFESETEELDRQLSNLGEPGHATQLIVRSNAIEEGLDERGLYHTSRSDGTLMGVLGAIEEVFKKSNAAELGIIVQRYVYPELSGHLSNERRVCKESRRFIFEARGEGVASQALRVERNRQVQLVPLYCKSAREIRQKLRDVGGYLYKLGGRFLVEWVWANGLLWIVQVDEESLAAGLSPVRFSSATPRKRRVGKLLTIRRYRVRDGKRWQKLSCVTTFNRMALPTTDFYVLEGARAISDLARGRVTKKLLQDLETLTIAPLVIRSDIEGMESILAPRTDTVRDKHVAARNLVSIATELTRKVPPKSICFIIHHFIAANASAFSSASPKRSRVLIDALWGLPDGLQFYPHDSFELDRAGRILKKRIRYKPSFLTAKSDGTWKRARTGTPWDWKQALSDRDAGEIARATYELAQRIDDAVQLMWFVGPGIGGEDHDVLPWRYTTEEMPARVESAIGRRITARPFRVGNDADLEKAEKESPSGLFLSPEERLIRDEDFLKRVAASSSRLKVPIHLEGSMLQHAYFVLRRAGANVVCLDPMESKTLLSKFDKLVRDNIPWKIRSSGEVVKAVSKGHDEYLWLLREKLVEEALEVLAAGGEQEMVEEAADVYEVLLSLCKAVGVETSKLIALADRKREALGGFDQGVVLLQTEDAPLVAIERQQRLFDERVRRVSGAISDVLVAGRRSRARHDRLILPLVPPGHGHHRGMRPLHLRQFGLSFEVHYHSKTVEIRVRASKPSLNRAQLHFKFP